MLERTDVYRIIDNERGYQDLMYDPRATLSTGVTRAQRDKDITSHLTLLDSYVRKAQDAWTDQKGGNSLKALQQLAKVAAIAVRALERTGGSEVLLNEGLR